jgi:hypothetical protein
MFIVVTGRTPHHLQAVPAFLYDGQSVVRQPEENFFGSYTLIVDTGTDEMYRSNYIKERLASNMWGTVMFATREEADQFVEDGKRL